MRISVAVYSSDWYGTIRNIACSECKKEIGQQIKINGRYTFRDAIKDDYIYCPFCGHKFNKDILKEIK